MSTEAPVTVMIVDDEPANLHLLEAILQAAGYHTRSFTEGAPALAAAREQPPDLLLLDIRLPGADGYEVCGQFQAQPATRQVPVVFMSGLRDTQAVVRGFEAGGRDYLTKPFNMAEVVARVGTHVRLSQTERKLEQERAHLATVVQERTRELQQAYTRLVALDSARDRMLHQLSHELRTPLNGILPLAGMLFEECVGNQTCPTAPMIRELKTVFDASRTRMLNVIDDILLLSRIYVGKQPPRREVVDFGDSLAGLLRNLSLTPVFRVRQAPAQAPAPPVTADPTLLNKVLSYLLITAHHATAGGGTWSLGASPDGRRLEAVLDLPGWRLTDQEHAAFFDPFNVERGENAGGLSGYSIDVVYNVLELMDGGIALTRGTGGGVCFRLTLAAAAADAPDAPPAEAAAAVD